MAIFITLIITFCDRFHALQFLRGRVDRSLAIHFTLQALKWASLRKLRCTVHSDHLWPHACHWIWRHHDHRTFTVWHLLDLLGRSADFRRRCDEIGVLLGVMVLRNRNSQVALNTATSLGASFKGHVGIRSIPVHSSIEQWCFRGLRCAF